jgi:hypothetical protein
MASLFAVLYWFCWQNWITFGRWTSGNVEFMAFLLFGLEFTLAGLIALSQLQRTTFPRLRCLPDVTSLYMP